MTGRMVAAARNFYVFLTVVERAEDDPDEHDRALFHGTIIHGVQFQDAESRRDPVSYYGEDTGVGRALHYFDKVADARVGVIGLGAGALATYAQPGSLFRFYEITPAVERLARSWFSFLSDAEGKVEVVIGDARLTLEREVDAPYHVLVLDAFSGDAIPAHLLTREAMDLYLRHLRPDGALIVHISNRYLDLGPVIRGLASYAGFQVVQINTEKSEGEHYATQWMVLSRNAGLLTELSAGAEPSGGRSLLWTDDFNDLFSILR
jgi:hypothetical protein